MRLIHSALVVTILVSARWICVVGHAAFSVTTTTRRRRQRFRPTGPCLCDTAAAPTEECAEEASSRPRRRRRIQSFVRDDLLRDRDTVYTRREILRRVHARHVEDCRHAVDQMAAEDDDGVTTTTDHDDDDAKSHDYEDVRTVSDDYLLARRSLTPLLNASSIALIRQAAEARWQRTTAGSSRFTFQRRGNSEAHVAELGPAVCDVVNDMLIRRIYPMIRRYYHHRPQPDDDDTRLCVYDALYIRYNATEAALHQSTTTTGQGAGQPLHRDLGIVSVNIMLNDDDAFEGGGTLMEQQLRDDDDVVAPLKPNGAGYALAHASGERHAGAATRRGVRDIMVLFITATTTTTARTPDLVLAAWCKQSQRACADPSGAVEGEKRRDDDDSSIRQQQREERILCCRLLHQSMAIQANPDDGEAWQYLANLLIQYADTMETEDTAHRRQRILTCAQEALEEAVDLVPCDARVWNTLARTLERIHQQQPERLAYDASTRNDDDDEENMASSSSSVCDAYERAIHLSERAQHVGCQVQRDLDGMRLNYGLYLANLDLFAQAAVVLEPVARRYEDENDLHKDNNDATGAMHRITADAYRLWRLCERRR